MPPPGGSSFGDHRSKDSYFVEVDCGDVLQVLLVVMKDFETSKKTNYYDRGIFGNFHLERLNNSNSWIPSQITSLLSPVPVTDSNLSKHDSD